MIVEYALPIKVVVFYALTKAYYTLYRPHVAV